MEAVKNSAPAASNAVSNAFEIANHIVTHSLALLQKKDMRELTRELRSRSA